jgi:hypothetical protein
LLSDGDFCILAATLTLLKTHRPPVSHPFKKGALVVLLNYNDHDPPHVHVKYQSDVSSYPSKSKAENG